MTQANNVAIESSQINSSGVLQPAGGGTGTASGVTDFKNRIINGAMNLYQRATGTVTPTAWTYTLDRWNVETTVASKFTVQQSSSAPAGFNNSYLLTSTSAYSVSSGDTIAVAQYIEGYNWADLGWGTANAKTVTLSFWVQSSLTGTFGGSLENYARTRSYPFTYTISSANTWTQISITIAGDITGTWVGASNSGAVCVLFEIGAGSTFSGTAGAWASADYRGATGATSVVGTSGATFYITGVQLEVGSSATGFGYRPYGTELALCQRYYQQGFTWVGKFNSTTSFYGYGNYLVPMRAAPTATYIAGGYISEITVADRSVTAIASYSGNNIGGYFQATTVSGATTGNLGANATSAPTIAGFSAEL